jgi:Domain of unknown function (DUF6268)
VARDLLALRAPRAAFVGSFPRLTGISSLGQVGVVCSPMPSQHLCRTLKRSLIFGIWIGGIVSGLASENETIGPLQSPPTSFTGPDWSASFEGDYTFGSRIRDFGSFGSQAEYHYSFQASRRFSWGDHWFFKIGFAEEQFQFSRSNEFLPYSLTKIAAQIAIGSSLTDSLSWEADASPGVYYTGDHITGNSFDVPVALLGHWKINPHFAVSLGVGANYFSQNPVLPIGGLVWNVTDRWTVSAGFPATRLTYQVTPRAQLYAGFDRQSGGFRNGPTNDQRTNNAILSYTENKLGGGLVLRPSRGVKLDLSSGFDFQREFNYFRSGPIFRSKGAPYLQAQLHVDL